VTDKEIMERAFWKQFPPEDVVLEAIRLAREDERERLKLDALRAEERRRIHALVDELKAKIG
jgi:hypothetical protein